MEDFNKYMEEFKKNSLEEKREISLEQLKIVSGLANTMCNELGAKNDIIITKDVVEGHQKLDSEEEFVEAVVVYTSSIQQSLCELVDRITEILEKKLEE